ncbi:hypothetical protein E3N88_18375 [Mikania micrantha]|uniref:Integrase catalytic domain-containing protein n=1 Tax=Mikania micrantha TaxID=192012 RepID=A0A5N6NLL7_9ASTR|nr:hypothetical protein E3N88_18375 [Mikania micrantha]
MTDYFSKWIEAEAFVQVREKEVISFIKRNILTRFGIPAEITCDNGSQFIGKRTTNFCEAWGIKMITSTPVHPKANGQAESRNKIIINNPKKNLGSNKGKWAEELPFVLWADRTTTKNATGQTPFLLVFGSEAVLPTEMIILTARTSLQTIEANNKNTTNPTDGKLAPKWEGPYKIDSEAGKGANSWRRYETICLSPSFDLKSKLDEDPALTLCLAAKF